jgi:hypothetical protein
MGGRQSMVWRPQPIREARVKPGGSQKHQGPRRTRLSPCFYGGAEGGRTPDLLNAILRFNSFVTLRKFRYTRFAQKNKGITENHDHGISPSFASGGSQVEAR